MSNNTPFDAVCQDYAMSKFASQQDAQRAMLQEITVLRAAKAEMLEALREIANGCEARRPGHIDACKNRTKAEIEALALAAIEKATSA